MQMCLREAGMALHTLADGLVSPTGHSRLRGDLDPQHPTTQHPTSSLAKLRETLAQSRSVQRHKNQQES